MLQAFSTWGASLRGAWNFIREAVRQKFVDTEIVGILSEEPFVLSLEEVDLASGLAITIHNASKYIEMLQTHETIPHLAHEPMGYVGGGEYRMNAEVSIWDRTTGQLETNWLTINSDEPLSQVDWDASLAEVADTYDWDARHEGFEIHYREFTRR